MEGLKPYIYHFQAHDASIKRLYTCSLLAFVKGPMAGKPMGFSEKVAFLPGVPHSFRRHSVDKTGDSSDPTLQSCVTSPECIEMLILKKERRKKKNNKNVHKKGVWKMKSICKLCTGKNSALRKKIK